MSKTIEEAIGIAERTFSDASRTQVISSIRSISQAELPEVLDDFAVFYLAILSVVHSGQECGVEPIWDWLVTFGYARQAGEIEYPDFTLDDGSRWIVSNHPFNLESIR